MTYLEIQQDAIKKYRITIESNSKCRGRMHAHVRERKICKWFPKNSYEATFDLLHEIGHIVNNNSKMRRAEEEYFATIWAIDRIKEYGKGVKERVLHTFQVYILEEMGRGLRRGGDGYGCLNIYEYSGIHKTLREVYNECDRLWQDCIGDEVLTVI